MRSPRVRLSGENGLAGALAVIIMTIMLIGAGTVLAQSTQLSGSVNRDEASKRAFQAAEAGLNVAKRRLNMLRPSDSECVTTELANPDSSGFCAEGSPESIGRGQTFTYRVSNSPLPSGRGCAAPVYTLPSGFTERCIVAVGEAAGIRRRLETRVAGNNQLPMFPFAGLLGLKGIVLNSNVPVKEEPIGSNDQVDVHTSAQAGTGIWLSPTAPAPRKFTPYAAYTGTVTRMDKPWRLPPPNFAPGGVDTAVPANFNNNLPIAPVADYTASSRTLTVPANTTVTLGSSSGGTFTYNFCDIVLGNSSRVVIATPSTVLIYLDSPGRTGSGCPAGTEGKIKSTSGGTGVGSATVIPTARFDNGDGSNSSTAPRNLRFQVYGNPTNPDAHELWIPNRGNWSMALFAPYSHVKFRRSGDVDGAVSANRITAYDGAADNPDHFHGNPAVANLTLPTPATYYRTGWRQCRSGAAVNPC